MDFAAIQKAIENEEIDGWLLYSFAHSNNLAADLLALKEKHITRRYFYWIPAIGEPALLCHQIDKENFSHLPGIKRCYTTWGEMEEGLALLIDGFKTVAMEYSPFNAIPAISKVDAGTWELVRRLGVDVVSSADLLQRFHAGLAPEQIASHFAAAAVVEQTAKKTWEWIAKKLHEGCEINEYAVQQKILEEFSHCHCITEDPPICAVNANSAIPHYCPSKEGSASINPGDFILIDLWCKQDLPNAIYADITQVAVAAKEAAARQKEIFCIVKAARDAATQLIQHTRDRALKGWEVDRACRRVIEEAGYGSYFIHRTGHSLGTSVHGDGCNIDDFETHEERTLLPGSFFTIEPGIYLPGEFGVRLEYDLYLSTENTVVITGTPQEEMITLYSSR